MLLWGILVLACLALGVGFLLWARWRWRATGLPAGRVVATDHQGWRRPPSPYYSARWNLTGRPDYVLHRQGRSIPVEVKSGRTPAAPYAGHLLQLGAYCLLIEDEEGLTPPYGLVRYPETTFQVPFNRRLRQSVLDALEAMQAAREAGGVRREHNDPRRCRACGYREACDQRLDMESHEPPGQQDTKEVGL